MESDTPPPPFTHTHTHGQLQVAIGFLRNNGKDPFSPIASRGRSVRPSVKYVDDNYKNSKQIAKE